MSNRDFLLDLIPKNGVGAEVGVWQGGFSQKLLDRTQPSRLFLVDPWTWDITGKVPRDCYIASTRIAKSQNDMDKLYEAVVKKFEAYDNVVVIREPSTYAACKFHGNDLDWVYIDGSHDYENVIADLRAWGPKVKPGGLLCGDDYEWGKKYNFPVRKAVQAFLKEGGYETVEIKNGQFVMRRL